MVSATSPRSATNNSSEPAALGPTSSNSQQQQESIGASTTGGVSNPAFTTDGAEQLEKEQKVDTEKSTEGTRETGHSTNGHHNRQAHSVTQNDSALGRGLDPDFKMSVSNADTVNADVEEYKQKAQEQRDREPLKFCKLIAERSGLTFGIFLVGHILMLLITAILVQVGYDIIPITFDRLPLDIRNDVDYLRGLAWTTRNKDESIITRGMDQSGNQSLRSATTEIIEMVFRVEGGNVFTKENLQEMKKVEESFFNDQKYQDKFCLLDSAGQCTKARSILRYFDGTYGTEPEFNNPNFDNPHETLYKASIDPRTKKMLQYHLGINAKISATAAESDITRGVLSLGGPLAGYMNTSDKTDDQKDEVELFMKNEFKSKAENYFEVGSGDLKFVYFSGTLLGLTITGQVFKDMSLAIGSLVFIIVFVCIQTGSLWVGLFAIFSIITSFCGANLIYRIILDYRYFGIFHVLAVFIILGIGADDVFVFFDTWKESGHHSYKTLAHRLSDCYRRAAVAMFFTSVTTAIAFATSASSPFLGIGSFGVFSCVLIIINYLSVITFFPCAVITYHKWWQKYKCFCCCPTRTPEEQTGGPDGKRKNPIVRFFKGPYYTVVTHGVAKWIILLFFAALLAVSIYFASTLKVNEEQVKFLPDYSNSGQYLALRSSAFASSSETSSTVYIVFGMKEQNLDKCHKSDPSCQGDPRWDDTFDLNDVEAQRKLLDLCIDLKSLSKEETDKMAIRRSLVNDVPEVKCFIEAMDVFFKSTINRTVPLSTSEVENLMTSKPFIYNMSALPSDFSRHFEVAMSYWLFNGFQVSPRSGLSLGSQLRTYNSELGEAQVEGLTIAKPLGPSGITYKYGTRLRYAAIRVNTTIQSSNYGFPKGLPIRAAWEEYLSNKISSMPKSLGSGFQVCVSNAINVWHWFKVQEKLASSAMIGIAIGICVAFPILVLATQNIIVGFLATLTICCITCSVIAVIPMAGWKLGMLESLNLVLVVGLSVDYVVHLAEGYSRSIHYDRKARTRAALEEVGISVLSGAFTTLGASAFLLGAFILFFTQFGIFMFSTIGFSILYALGFFITLIGIIGPQGETGSLKPIWRWCGRKGVPGCKEPDKSHVQTNGTNGINGTTN